MPQERPCAREGAASPGVCSGVPGLDEILGGGFPQNRITLITGGPGAGKTTLGLQFLSAGAREGERGLFLALSETAEELQAAAASLSISLNGIEVAEVLPPAESTPEATLFQAGEIELSDAAHRIIEQIERVKPRRVVIDFVSALRLLFQDELQFQRYLLTLKRLAQQGMTMLLVEAGAGDLHLRVFANGIVELEKLSREYGTIRRRLSVSKLRGTAYPTGFHDFSIDTGGLTVYPHAEPPMQPLQPPPRETMSSGLPELDAVLGGGLRLGSSALFLGASGSGKSTLASQFAVAAALRGDPALILSIDERCEDCTLRCRGLGIDIDGARATGRFRLERLDPVGISPGQFSRKVLNGVANYGARVVVIDTVSGYMSAMREERSVVLQFRELLGFLAARHVLTLLLLSDPVLLGQRPTAPLYIGYMSDAILVFRFFERHGAVHRCIAMLKKRYGPHDSGIHELKLEPGRISVGPTLTDMRGIMTGYPAGSAPTDEHH